MVELSYLQQWQYHDHLRGNGKGKGVKGRKGKEEVGREGRE